MTDKSSELQQIAQRVATPFPGPIEWDRVADAQTIIALEREKAQVERECMTLHEALAEAIRRLKIAHAGRPRRGLGYRDLLDVLDRLEDAPQPWRTPAAKAAREAAGIKP